MGEGIGRLRSGYVTKRVDGWTNKGLTRWTDEYFIFAWQHRLNQPVNYPIFATFDGSFKMRLSGLISPLSIRGDILSRSWELVTFK